MNRGLPTTMASGGGFVAAWGHYLGRLREMNADAALANVQTGVFLLSDGMGGTVGEMASRLIVDNLPDMIAYHLRTTGKERSGSPRRALLDALMEINHKVREEGSRMAGQCDHVGAAVVAACALEGTLWIAHMGDSRAYLLHGAALSLLTRDHRTTDQLVQSGVFGADDDPGLLEWRGKLSRYVGIGGDAVADISSVPFHQGDRLLLCTDGLWETVAESDMARLLADPGGPQKACRALLEAAREGRSRDNATALVVEKTATG